MTRRVYRYELPVTDEPITIPSGKVVLLTKKRGFIPRQHLIEVWVEITLPINVYRRVQIVGTGHDVPDGAEHVASTLDGDFVWHLYLLAPTELDQL